MWSVRKYQLTELTFTENMITDILDNADLYTSLNEHFGKAFSYLKETDFALVEKGIYNIEGDDVFAIVNEFETKDKSECEAEAHKKFIDIQYKVKGTEMIGYLPLTIQKPAIDYNEANDVTIYNEDVSYLKLEAGAFIIFFPTDIHQPEVKEFEPVIVKKVVIKIKINNNLK